jgi:magnesium transporter
VSIRELTLGLVHPREHGRVVAKEAAVGLVVGGALAANTLLSVCLGGSLPLLLRRMRLDPALVSGPALTTVTDMCGFFLVLSFATALLPLLVGV